ncbi:hypothetical protein SZN_05417 [Streptomyces zinciresistens K42]|uniref:Uncharacterized protein n=1 Tax=Streptomyces zinciresistens K42 TaxID=700597 RepID=G2G6H6_9ACTN|nr:hypothetical protein [Streptomyces zinciresistens]EGX60867.1 hypothetical protein SZN_05417 [Streptomyces zinciresistens K42]
MTTHRDDDLNGPEFGPDDPLAVVLRPAPEHLAAPPGRYEAVRRRAARRRLARTAAGAGVTCAVALLVALPLVTRSPDGATTPAPPLAPPPASGPVTSPDPAPPERRSAPPRPTEASEPPVPTPSRPTVNPRQDTVRPARPSTSADPSTPPERSAPTARPTDGERVRGPVAPRS